MKTESGVSILAEDCQEALKTVLDFVEATDKGTLVANAANLLWGLLDEPTYYSDKDGNKVEIDKEKGTTNPF